MRIEDLIKILQSKQQEGYTDIVHFDEDGDLSHETFSEIEVSERTIPVQRIDSAYPYNVYVYREIEHLTSQKTLIIKG